VLSDFPVERVGDGGEGSEEGDAEVSAILGAMTAMCVAIGVFEG
jgi:hypothetical protein